MFGDLEKYDCYKTVNGEQLEAFRIREITKDEGVYQVCAVKGEQGEQKA